MCLQLEETFITDASLKIDTELLFRQVVCVCVCVCVCVHGVCVFVCLLKCTPSLNFLRSHIHTHARTIGTIYY